MTLMPFHASRHDLMPPPRVKRQERARERRLRDAFAAGAIDVTMMLPPATAATMPRPRRFCFADDVLLDICAF